VSAALKSSVLRIMLAELKLVAFYAVQERWFQMIGVEMHVEVFTNFTLGIDCIFHCQPCFTEDFETIT